MAETERRRVGGDRAETERRRGDRAESHTAPHTGYSGDRRGRHRGLQVGFDLFSQAILFQTNPSIPMIDLSNSGVLIKKGY